MFFTVIIKADVDKAAILLDAFGNFDFDAGRITNGVFNGVFDPADRCIIGSVSTLIFSSGIKNGNATVCVGCDQA